MLTEDNAAGLVDQFISRELRALQYPEGRFSGRGVVIAAGGRTLLTNAWVAIRMLRRSGCTLPVEVWHLGVREYDTHWAQLVEPFDVRCVDACEVRKTYPHQRLHGWELKPYAITHCPFKEVLYLDADNVPIVDPAFLFDTPQYQEHGTIFWPDFGRLGPDRSAWRVFGNIPYRDEPEVESGQIVIDKSRTWDCLMLCHWYMQNSNNFFFYHVHGDKEVFHVAWRKLDRAYAMPARGIDALPCVMCQHDFQGRRIFQHRNMRKWSLSRNPETPGFLYERECFEYLDELRRRWIPANVADEMRSAAVQEATRQAAGRYQYHRLGHDRRALQLEPNGLVSFGAAGREAAWYCRADRLHLLGEDGELTAELMRLPDGNWYGRWLKHEQMPVVLERDGARAANDE